MNLHHLLMTRNQEKGPRRVGLIGAGKFGSMYLAQAVSTEGIHMAAIADLVPSRLFGGPVGGMDRERRPPSRTHWRKERPSSPTMPPR